MNEKNPKIYVLPNLMTAGNLFCGFAAILTIFKGMHAIEAEADFIPYYYKAIGFILGACLFDLLDGRLARLGRQESVFGREFDSIADIVSFGVAPSLLVFSIVLKDFENELGLNHMGWVIASVYLLCGAMRLARFNCQSINSNQRSKDFRGFPIPAAAGVIASLTFLMLYLEEGAKQIGGWKYVLPVLMLFLSFMMFSNIRYPSFKSINWRAKKPLPLVFAIALLLLATILYYWFMPAVIFIGYLCYGLVRPLIAKKKVQVKKVSTAKNKSVQGYE